MGFQKFGTGDVLGQDREDAQGIQTVGAAAQPWTSTDDVELEQESTTDGPIQIAEEE